MESYNLLLIDSSIRGLNIFTESINANTKYIVYDKNFDTFDSIETSIANLDISAFSYVGFVFDNNEMNNKIFLENENYINYTKRYIYDENGNLVDTIIDISENRTTDFINKLVSQYSVPTVDFLGCGLLSNPIWKAYFNYLTDINTIKVRASDDNTGNLSSGGDWILESTGEDVSLLYFTSNIEHWTYLLGNIPILSTNGTVYTMAYDTISNSVYIGGSFTQVDVDGSRTPVSAKHIAKYSFIDSSWSVLGSDSSWNGVAGGTTQVRTIFVDASGLVYVGGTFTSAYDASGTTTVGNVARFDSTTNKWTALGTDLNTGVVRAILVRKSDKRIYAGGDFTSGGTGNGNAPGITGAGTGCNYLAYRDTSWAGILFYGATTGTTNPGPVYRIRFDTSENNMYVAGTFSALVKNGTPSYNGLIKVKLSDNSIDTSANGIGGGVNTNGINGINAMRYYRDASNNEYLYIAGNFTELPKGTTSKAPFARYNLTSAKWDVSFSSTGWTVTNINTIELDDAGNPYFGGTGFTSANSVTGSNFYRYRFTRTFDASGNVSGYNIHAGTGDILAAGGGVKVAYGAEPLSLEMMLRTGSNFLLGGNFTQTDGSGVASNLSYYVYDNSASDASGVTYNYDNNFSSNPAFDTLDTVGNSSINLKKYLEKNLPLVAASKETKFQNYVKGKSAVFIDRFADISGSYLRNSGSFKYGYFTDMTSDISGTIASKNVRYVIPNTGYNGNNGTFDCSDVSLSGVKYLYFPVTAPETFAVKIKGVTYTAFNYQPPNPSIGYNNPNGSSQTANLGTVMPLVSSDNSKNTWLDSFRVIGWGSVLVEYGSGTFYNCITDDTDLLTPNGYINVKELQNGDIIVTDTGKHVSIKNIQVAFLINSKQNNPYIIAKDSIEKGYPSCDVKISSNHLIKYNDKWICPYKNKCFRQDDSYNYVPYYHIELEDYNDNLVVSGGLIIEGLAKKGTDGELIRKERLKNLHKIN